MTDEVDDSMLAFSFSFFSILLREQGTRSRPSVYGCLYEQLDDRVFSYVPFFLSSWNRALVANNGREGGKRGRRFSIRLYGTMSRVPAPWQT